MAIAFMTVFVAVAFIPASATIINVPDDYGTIQEGIDASSDGDTVLVQPGTYIENIFFNGHNIVLGSLFLTTGDTAYINSTIICGDSLSSESVVTFVNEEDSTAIISGFLLQNGSTNYGGGIACGTSSPTINNNIISNNFANNSGGGIYCYNSSPTISNNIISDNIAGYNGGGICCRTNSSPSIRNNTINNNIASYAGGGILTYNSTPIICNNIISENIANGENLYGGGGIHCWSSSPIINNNTIIGNIAIDNGGGICCYYNSNPTLSNNTITGNSADCGGGISFWYSSPTIINNTISGNTAEGSGGGIYCVIVSNPVITNTIFWGDNAQYYPEIWCDTSSSPVISYCDIQDTLWPGEGNISVDPLFRDPENFDFHLMADSCGDVYNSPCIDAGDPAIFDSMLGCDWGLGELRSDMGAYGGARIPTDVDEEQIPETPMQFLLSQNHPNPFNVSTVIRYDLPSASDVNIDIYDILGRRVQTLLSEEQRAGYHRIVWDASGHSSGMYFYRIQAGDYTETRKMVLLK